MSFELQSYSWCLTWFLKFYPFSEGNKVENKKLILKIKSFFTLFNGSTFTTGVPKCGDLMNRFIIWSFSVSPTNTSTVPPSPGHDPEYVSSVISASVNLKKNKEVDRIKTILIKKMSFLTLINPLQKDPCTSFGSIFSISCKRPNRIEIERLKDGRQKKEWEVGVRKGNCVRTRKERIGTCYQRKYGCWGFTSRKLNYRLRFW